MRTADRHIRKRIETTLAKAGIASWVSKPVAAYLNHGRWVADCVCNGAELVMSGHTMLCGSCGAESEVAFPANQTEIESLVAKRPLPNQNWQGETTSELVAENIENGLWDGLDSS